MKKSMVTGDRQLANALRELSKGVPISTIDKAARDSMNPMLLDAKANAKRQRNYIGKYPGFPQPKSPRAGGHVDQGIIFGRDKTSTRTKRRFTLGATGRARKLLHLLEFGTMPHWQPRFKGGFQHPGAKARPVMTPAYESHADDVEMRFGQSLWVALRAKVLQLKARRR